MELNTTPTARDYRPLKSSEVSQETHDAYVEYLLGNNPEFEPNYRVHAKNDN